MVGGRVGGLDLAHGQAQGVFNLGDLVGLVALGDLFGVVDQPLEGWSRVAASVADAERGVSTLADGLVL